MLCTLIVPLGILTPLLSTIVKSLFDTCCVAAKVASLKLLVDQPPIPAAPLESFKITLFNSDIIPDVDVSQKISKLDSTGAVSNIAKL